jgi:hypothetical protein
MSRTGWGEWKGRGITRAAAFATPLTREGLSFTGSMRVVRVRVPALLSYTGESKWPNVADSLVAFAPTPISVASGPLHRHAGFKTG